MMMMMMITELNIMYLMNLGEASMHHTVDVRGNRGVATLKKLRFPVNLHDGMFEKH